MFENEHTKIESISSMACIAVAILLAFLALRAAADDPASCDDGDLCTMDSFFKGECYHDRAACDDRRACTHDECVDGKCVYWKIGACECDAATPCDGCDACDEVTHQCAHRECASPSVLELNALMWNLLMVLMGIVVLVAIHCTWGLQF